MASQTAPTFTTSFGLDLSIKDIADIYRDIVSLAIPASGRIHRISQDCLGLTCNFKTTDCDNLETIQTSKSYSVNIAAKVDRHIESVRCISQPQLVSELAVVTSENGRFLARLKAAKEPDSKRQFLEIWERSKQLRCFDIGEIEEHGPINVDAIFSSMYWSPNGEQDKLLYVCQSKEPKIPSFFKQQVEGSKKQNIGDGYLRSEDWGECLSGIAHTIVAVLDINTFKFTTFEVKNFSLAESRWLNDGACIVSTAYPEEPRRLGLMHSNNRPNKLVIHSTEDGSCVQEISLEGQSLHGLRVSHCGKRILYLTSATFGAHHHSVSMHLYDLAKGNSKQLAEEQFIISMPKNCFSVDDKHVLFTTKDYITHHMCILNLETGQISRIKFPTSGVDILDFRYDLILATGSEINTTPTIYVATLSSPDLVAWHQIEDCIHVDEINYQDLRIETADKQSTVSALLVTPNLRALYRNNKLEDTGKHESELPTVVIIHGGPHSSVAMYYSAILVLHARLGFKTLLINYRGSLGVNEDYVRSLCGKVGTQDVDDCLQVIRHLSKSKTIDPTKLIISGGSHGGFLACHLSCQKEFKFTSAIIRNPVVDISTMHTTSDMPDWCYTEALGHDRFNFDWLPDDNERNQMYRCSPMGRFGDAYVPTFMFLGSCDKRVPMFQGERWHQLLKARHVETRCKVYSDKHDLSKPEVAADSNITAVMWMLEHLPKP